MCMCLMLVLGAVLTAGAATQGPGADDGSTGFQLETASSGLVSLTYIEPRLDMRWSAPCSRILLVYMTTHIVTA